MSMSTVKQNLPLENFTRLNQEFKKLILYSGRIFFLKGGDLTHSQDIDDYVQEIMEHTWKLCLKYKNKKYEDMRKLFKQTMWMYNKYYYRKNHSKKHQHTNISLSALENPEDFLDNVMSKSPDNTQNLLKDILISHIDFDNLKESFLKYLEDSNVDETAIKVYRCLTLKDGDFHKFCEKNKRKYFNKTNLSKFLKITQSSLAKRILILKQEFLNFKDEKLNVREYQK